MTLNVNKLPRRTRKFVEQPELEPGVYPARVVQIISFGLQKQRPYRGQEKEPAYEIGITYELVDEFMIDENGEELTDKPRWVSEIMPLHSPEATRAKSNARLKALDPENKYEGDFGQLTGTPCNVSIAKNVYNGKTYFNVSDVGTMRQKEAENLSELKNEPRVFSLGDPDLEVFNAFPKWIQEKIVGNLEYKGSKLELLLEGKNSEPDEEVV